MAVHEKKESFKEHNDRGSILLAFYFVLTLLIPNLVLLYTEPYSIWSAEASLFIPMGFYLMWSAVLKRSGIMIWLAFPLVVLAAPSRSYCSTCSAIRSSQRICSPTC